MIFYDRSHFPRASILPLAIVSTDHSVNCKRMVIFLSRAPAETITTTTSYLFDGDVDENADKIQQKKISSSSSARIFRLFSTFLRPDVAPRFLSFFFLSLFFPSAVRLIRCFRAVAFQQGNGREKAHSRWAAAKPNPLLQEGRNHSCLPSDGGHGDANKARRIECFFTSCRIQAGCCLEWPGFQRERCNGVISVSKTVLTRRADGISRKLASLAPDEFFLFFEHFRCFSLGMTIWCPSPFRY